VIYRWNERDRALEVIRRTPLEDSAEINRRRADLRFDYEAVSRR
jgi:hypothetical protein